MSESDHTLRLWSPECIITAGQRTFSREKHCLSVLILICTEEMSGWWFSELKTEATETVDYLNNVQLYVRVNFIMSLHYVVPYFKSYFAHWVNLTDPLGSLLIL